MLYPFQMHNDVLLCFLSHLGFTITRLELESLWTSVGSHQRLKPSISLVNALQGVRLYCFLFKTIITIIHQGLEKPSQDGMKRFNTMVWTGLTSCEKRARKYYWLSTKRGKNEYRLAAKKNELRFSGNWQRSKILTDNRQSNGILTNRHVDPPRHSDPLIQMSITIEVLHGSHVAWQKQWKYFAHERTSFPIGKGIFCSCHATWLPCKTSIDHGLLMVYEIKIVGKRKSAIQWPGIEPGPPT